MTGKSCWRRSRRFVHGDERGDLLHRVDIRGLDKALHHRAMAETKPASEPASVAGSASAKSGKKAKLVLLAVPVLLLCGGLGLWFSGILPGLLGMHPGQPEPVSGQARPAAPRLPIFVQMPDITANLNASGRRATFIKMRSQIEVLGQDDAAALTSALPRLAKVQFEFDRLEVNPRFAMITRHANACILARLRVEMEDRGGKIEILLPYASLEPVREVLLQQFMGEKFGRDSIWETHLAQELRHTDVALDVVLHQQIMPLSTILDLKIGDRLVLDSKPNAPVSLQCGQVPLFSAELGQVEGRPSVRIAETLLSAGVAA